MIENPHRSELSSIPFLNDALDWITAKWTAFFGREHNADGTHSNVTATTITPASDPADGSWSGNLGASLVPTTSTVDLGARITRNGSIVKDHPFRNLRLSADINWATYTDSVTPATGPSITRSGNALTVAGAPNLAGGSVNIVGNGGGGASCTLTVSSLAVSSSKGIAATTDVSATTSVFAGTSFNLTDGITAPTATAGTAKIYVDTADGDLKIIFGDGVVKTIVVDT